MTHIILVAAVIVYAIAVTQSIEYCAIPHTSTSLAPESANKIIILTLSRQSGVGLMSYNI